MLLKHTHIVVESGWATNKQSEQQLRNYSKMKVYGAISSSLAEDAPLLHNTQDEKKPPLFKGALTASSRKTIALAVAGVAACGAVAIVAKGSGNGISAPIGAFRLGDALEDAKAGKKETFVPI